jgi:hypothetical protein
MKLDPAVRVADKKPDGQGLTLRPFDYHSDLPRLREETPKQRARVIG